jgi:pantothenate synthetase
MLYMDSRSWPGTVLGALGGREQVEQLTDGVRQAFHDELDHLAQEGRMLEAVDGLPVSSRNRGLVEDMQAQRGDLYRRIAEASEDVRGTGSAA